MSDYKDVVVKFFKDEMTTADFPTAFPMSFLLSECNRLGLEGFSLFGELSEAIDGGVRTTLTFRKQENPGLLG